jgi:hypothetical protein
MVLRPKDKLKAEHDSHHNASHYHPPTAGAVSLDHQVHLEILGPQIGRPS